MSGIVFLRSLAIADAPGIPCEAEQIEFRAILLEGNTHIGNFSDAKPAFIAQ